MQTSEGPAAGAAGWQRWFQTPYPVAVRPAVGGGDLTVVLRQGPDSFILGVLDHRTGELREVPHPNPSAEATVTADGAWVLDLDDPAGSEVGHLHATPTDGSVGIDLTPDVGGYVVRGLDVTRDNRFVVLTAVDAAGFTVWLLDLRGTLPARRLFHSAAEAWSAIVSADARYVAVDTTDHNPGVRRFAVTVVDVATGEPVATLSDGPTGPVRRVAFSTVPGDRRLLASTERTGFARPVVWDPVTGARHDIAEPDLPGDVLALDWHAPSGCVLLLHVDDGVHRLLEHDLGTGTTRPVTHPPGAYGDVDVASTFPYTFTSHYAPDGTLRLVRSTWETPLHLVEVAPAGLRTVLPPAPVPTGTALRSHTLTSRDGLRLQLWAGLPAGRARGAVLEVHGGPNLATVDRFDPCAQAWLDEGYAFASLNYRGSVGFGREFRESFWGAVGRGELDDIATAVAWLTDEGGVDPTAIYLTGESYGGFLTLLALGRLPDLFAGGLAHVALADWAAAYADMSPALRAAWRAFMGGAPDDRPQAWEDASPIAHVTAVRAPVWLNQGVHDTRTPPAQAQRYADALTAAGGDVLLEWFAGGHVPGGLAGKRHSQERMLTLVARSEQGLRWVDIASTHPPGSG